MSKSRSHPPELVSECILKQLHLGLLIPCSSTDSTLSLSSVLPFNQVVMLLYALCLFGVIVRASAQPAEVAWYLS